MIQVLPQPGDAALHCLKRILFVAAVSATACGSRTDLVAPNSDRECVIADNGAVITIEAVLAPPKVDVVFVIDTSASMYWTIDAVRNEIATQIAPTLQARVPSVEFAVAAFGDFDLNADLFPEYSVVSMTQQLTPSVPAIRAAMARLRLGGGGDEPEAQLEALRQVMTGVGLPNHIHAAPPCPVGRWGGACFRNGALPVVMLFTNGPMHNGPDGSAPYDDRRFVVPPAHYEDTVSTLLDARVRFAGFWSEAEDETLLGLEELRRLAIDLRAVNRTGDPLVFDLGEDAERASETLAPAINEMLDSLVMDLELVVDDPDLTDGIDATSRIRSVRVASWVPRDGAAGASSDGHRVLEVSAGTRVRFEVEITPGPPHPATEPLQQLTFRVVGDDRVALVERSIFLADGPQDARCTTFAM